jgi:hypothetical protein
VYPRGAWAAPRSPLTLPLTTLYAIWLMLVGAALEIVAAGVADATNESLQPRFAAAMHGSGAALVQAVTVAHAETIVFNSIVACVVWMTMAYANWRARSSTPASSR